MDNVRFEILSDDLMSRTTWVFFLLGKTLVVDLYLDETRDSLRKKFKEVPGRKWTRLYRRESTMKQEEVPLTDEIAAQAKEAFIEKIRHDISVGFQRA
jgi:hypothetical protein